MLIRTVRMTLRPEAVPAFLDMFREARAQIRAFPGCRHLELWQDEKFPNIFTSYSHWQSAEALERYRESAFFRETWRTASAFFAAPAVAHSCVAVGGAPDH